MSEEKDEAQEQESPQEAGQESPQEGGGETAAPAPETPAGGESIDAQDIKDGKILAILSYIIGILCIVPLIQRNNAYSLYHAKQVLLIIIASIVLGIVNVIPCAGQIVSGLGYMALLVLWVMGLINACSDKAKPMPLIGKFAEDWFKGITKQ